MRELLNKKLIKMARKGWLCLWTQMIRNLQNFLRNKTMWQIIRFPLTWTMMRNKKKAI